MKTYQKLWERLDVDKAKCAAIKRDWTEGKVPDLPFIIVDQRNVKECIQEKLQKIDGSRMETTILQAHYGDGKTNVFKYLQLYFNNYSENNVRLIYCRANPDQTDLCMFLMQHIQMSCMDDLRTQIKELSANPDFDASSLAGDFKNDFAAIKEYASALFNPNNVDNLDSLIYLGTGRLYSKGMFDKFHLNKLTDFNRREVFVLFMNILASAGIYVVFAIDELEKIHDKSSKRMAHYFTSYRELVDLFNKINGHYLISAITDGVDISSLCPPLYDRVHNDLVELKTLKEEKDISDLVKLVAELLEIEAEEGKVKDVVGKIKRKQGLSNRRMIQFVSEQLSLVEEHNIESLDEALSENAELKQLFEDTRNKISEENGFLNLSRAFFDPLDYYLIALGYRLNGNYRRDYQAVVDDDMHKAFFFLFNDDTKIRNRIIDFAEKKNINDFVVFAKKEMDVNYSQLQISDTKVRIVEYDPDDLFVLLNMYRWNFDKQREISKLLALATKNAF